jgi:hypothetical protein
MCDPDKAHLVGYEVGAEDGFYQERWQREQFEKKNVDEDLTDETEKAAQHGEESKQEQGIQKKIEY